MSLAPYGVREDGNIQDAPYDSSAVDHSVTVPLGDPELVRIDRLRLLTDPGFPYLDVSYVWGTLRDGSKVRVDLGRYQFGRRTYKSELVALCSEAGRYGKGLGIFDALSILWG